MKFYIIGIVFVVLLAAGVGVFFFRDHKREVVTVRESEASTKDHTTVEEESAETEKKDDEMGARVDEAPDALPQEEVAAGEGEEEKKEKATEEATQKVSVEEKEDEKKSALNMKDRLVSWGYTSASGRTIDTIILHSSYNSLGGDEYDVSKIIDIYKQYDVSAHYIIGRDGTIYRLVKEKDVSWHAGASTMPDGRTNVNAFSIGIELVNDQEDDYTTKQYDAVNALIADIKDRYTIGAVLGHDDIAPGRKTDPWGMEWDRIER